MTASKKSPVDSFPDRIFQDFHSELFYSYQVARVSTQKKFFVCSLRHSNGCNAQGVIDADGNFRYVTDDDDDHTRNPHNHVGEPNLLEDAIFFKRLRSLHRHSFLSGHVVYNQLKDLYPNAAKKYPFQTLSPRMRQWRMKREFPDLAGSLDNFTNLLNNHLDWKNRRIHEKGSMSIKPILRKNQACGISIADQEFLVAVEASLHKVIYFEEVAIQLKGMGESRVILMTVPHKNHSFPGLWAVLNEKSFESCNELVRNGLAKPIGAIQPEKIYYDFDDDMFNALQLRYPASRVKGTFDAYCNLLYSKAVEKIDLRGKQAENEIRVFTKLLMLCFLPAELIISTFMKLVQKLSNDLFRVFKSFLEYYLSEWICKVGASNLSFHNDLDALSNCTKIHCNRLINSCGRQPNTWSFFESTIKIQVQSCRDMEKLANKKVLNTGTSPVGKLIDVAKIKRLQDLVESGEIDALDFLSRGARIAQQLVGNLIFINAGPKTAFRMVDLVPVHHKLLLSIDYMRNLELDQPNPLLVGDFDPVNDNNDEPDNEENQFAEDDLQNEADEDAVDVNHEEIGELDQNDIIQDDNGIATADGVNYYRVAICVACSEDEAQPDVIYNPCRHCIFCQPCQKKYVTYLTKNKKILKCSCCRVEVTSVDLIIKKKSVCFISLIINRSLFYVIKKKKKV